MSDSSDKGFLDNTLRRSAEGDAEAKELLTATLYEQMLQIAQRQMQQERAGHTLQATAIVHEAWMKLVRQKNVDPSHRSHYLAAAATTIRRILVDYARRRRTHKRGGPDQQKIPLHEMAPNDAKQSGGALDQPDIFALDEALTRLAELRSRAAQVVELRYFGGMTLEEVAMELKVSLGTVNNDWRFARAWLANELS